MYKWAKYNCIATPVWGVRVSGDTGSRSYSKSQKAAYVESAGRDHPTINSDGKFTFTDGSSAALSSSNYSGKYWIANADSVKLNTGTGDVSGHYAVVTSFDSGWLSNSATATIYETYQTGTTYSRGTYIGEVTEDERNAHPDDGRDENDGYWYVFIGEIGTKTLSVTYNDATIINEEVSGDVEITYNGRTLATLSSGTKTLDILGSDQKPKILATPITIGDKTISDVNGSGKKWIVEHNISITLI